MHYTKEKEIDGIIYLELGYTPERPLIELVSSPVGLPPVPDKSFADELLRGSELENAEVI